MGGKLQLISNKQEGTTFFFDLDLEKTDDDIIYNKNRFSDLNVAILSSLTKIKEQDIYIKEYLDYYGVRYTTFINKEGLEKIIQSSKPPSFILIDLDYTDDSSLKEYAKLLNKIVLITNTSMMNKIDNSEFNVCKTLYSPIHAIKIKETLQIYVKNNTLKPELVLDKQKNIKFDADILVAEDNTINQKLIKSVLETMGLNVSIASDGQEAFHNAKEEKFDLIFMDIQMPVLDGIEATQAILQHEQTFKKKHTPIVALTANALQGDKERLLGLGFDEYTTKPLVRDEIISILKKYLN